MSWFLLKLIIRKNVQYHDMQTVPVKPDQFPIISDQSPSCFVAQQIVHSLSALIFDIVYVSRLTVTVACKLSLQMFPHDVQTCTVMLESCKYPSIITSVLYLLHNFRGHFLDTFLNDFFHRTKRSYFLHGVIFKRRNDNKNSFSIVRESFTLILFFSNLCCYEQILYIQRSFLINHLNTRRT